MQHGTFSNIDRIGQLLSIAIGCSVRWNEDTDSFVCSCGVVFPIDELMKCNDMNWAADKHKEANK